MLSTRGGKGGKGGGEGAASAAAAAAAATPPLAAAIVGRQCGVQHVLLT